MRLKREGLYTKNWVLLIPMNDVQPIFMITGHVINGIFFRYFIYKIGSNTNIGMIRIYNITGNYTDIRVKMLYIMD